MRTLFRNVKKRTVSVCVIVTAMFLILKRFGNSRSTASLYYETIRLIGNNVDHPISVEPVSNESLSASIASAATAISFNASSLSGPLCIYAQSRGWGNSLFVVFSFLSQAVEIIQQQQVTLQETSSGFIDLRTGLPCHHDNANVHCVNHSFPCIFVEDEENSNSFSDSDTMNFSSLRFSSSSPPVSLGNVYANLFVHMHACPNEPEIYNATSCPRRFGQRENVHEVFNGERIIHEYRHYLPQLFQLNGSHIEYLLQSTQSELTLEQLQYSNICAVQFRFGDYWFRNDHRKNKTIKGDKRLCREYAKDTSTKTKGGRPLKYNITECFQHEATVLLQKACPDPSIPVYLATDWNAIEQYMCQNHQKSSSSAPATNASLENNHSSKRIFLSHCPLSSSSSTLLEYNIPNEHIHDVNFHSDGGRKVLHHMLVDWLALALSQSSSLRKQHFVQKRANNNEKITNNSKSQQTNIDHSMLSEEQQPPLHFSILDYDSTFAATADLNWSVVTVV